MPRMVEKNGNGLRWKSRTRKRLYLNSPLLDRLPWNLMVSDDFATVLVNCNSIVGQARSIITLWEQNYSLVVFRQVLWFVEKQKEIVKDGKYNSSLKRIIICIKRFWSKDYCDLIYSSSLLFVKLIKYFQGNKMRALPVEGVLLIKTDCVLGSSKN